MNWLIPPWVKVALWAAAAAAIIAAYQWHASSLRAEGYEAADSEWKARDSARIQKEQEEALAASEQRRKDEQAKAQEQAAIVAAVEQERDRAIQNAEAVVAAAAADRRKLRRDVQIAGCGAGAKSAAIAAGSEQIAGLSAQAVSRILRVGIDADAELRKCWAIARSDRGLKMREAPKPACKSGNLCATTSP